MSYTTYQWRSAISKLLKLTSTQEVSWSPSKKFSGDAWTLVDQSFETNFSDKYFVVSATRFKHFFDEDEWIWGSGYDLSVFVKDDGSYEKIASSPDMSLVSNLFIAAQANYAYRRGALDDLIDK